MKLKKLSLNNFGRFRGEVLKLEDGINVIYGENESGKSTVHTFIRSMLFGMKRGRGRAAGNDVYSRYEPWENASWYQGRMEFTSGGKEFRLTRSFAKGAGEDELVCLTDGEILSLEDGDLSVLLGGISENVYENTVSVGQLKARTGDALAQELRNYMANYQGSNDGSLNVEAALTSLKKKRKELEQEAELQRKAGEEEKSRMYSRLSYLEQDCREAKERLERTMTERKREMFGNEVSPREVRKQQERFLTRRKYGIACAVVAVFLAVLSVMQFFGVSSLFTRLGLGISVLALIFIIYQMFRYTREEDEEIIEPEQQKIRKLNWNVEYLEKETRQKEIQCQNLREEYEEFCASLTIPAEQQENIAAVTLAMETIEKISRQQQSRVGIRLRQSISEILSELTDGKYRQVSMDDDLKIGIHSENYYVPLQKTSRGTMEQVYFALRMAVMDILCSEEEMPVLLDETFAMYDEYRLERALTWLANKKRQVVIFTCQKREEQTLDRLGIPYHKVDLSVDL